jgi:hypothetical protein
MAVSAPTSLDIPVIPFSIHLSRITRQAPPA